MVAHLGMHLQLARICKRYHMSKYAFVENDTIVSIHDVLPTNWRNVSNFNALLNDVEYLRSLGWYVIERDNTPYNESTQYVSAANYQYLNNRVIELNTISARPEAAPPTEEELARISQEKWNEICTMRDQKMNEFEWRYVRYDRERRLGLSTTDNLTRMDAYMQQLANLPTAFPQPENVIWPVWDE